MEEELKEKLFNKKKVGGKTLILEEKRKYLIFVKIIWTF